jgi:hypothetical protein
VVTTAAEGPPIGMPAPARTQQSEPTPSPAHYGHGTFAAPR